MTDDERDELIFLTARAVLVLMDVNEGGADTSDACVSLAVAVSSVMPKMPPYCREGIEVLEPKG